MLDRDERQRPATYDPAAIEARRQAAWRERDAFRTPAIDQRRAHVYIKPSAPFTSGNIHIGHVRSYSIGDAYARFRRARGDEVLFAFGFDAFGLPAELGAIAGGEPPSEWVARCAQRMTGQLERLGYSFDWERTFVSSEPIMYRWSQWLFLTLLAAGLIYRGSGNVDWCDTCQTTLATIQVEDGLCWRCHEPGAADPAAPVVPAHQRIRARERQPPGRARRRAASGTRSRWPASASCSGAWTAWRPTCARRTASH